MLVAISIRLREIVALALVLALIAAAFALPPYYADADEPETEPVSAGSARETVLIIDAGHGGEDGGAVTADGVPESGINLGIAKKLEALCGLFGVDSVMTRESQEISYPDTAGTTAQRKSADQKARVELINSQEDAVLVSIHQNFFPDSRPFGCQVLYGKTDGSRELAELAHSMLTEDIYLMRAAKCTAILVECGFLSNTAEAALLQTEAYQLKISALLLASYLQYEASTDGRVL